MKRLMRFEEFQAYGLYIKPNTTKEEVFESFREYVWAYLNAFIDKLALIYDIYVVPSDLPEEGIVEFFEQSKEKLLEYNLKTHKIKLLKILARCKMWCLISVKANSIEEARIQNPLGDYTTKSGKGVWRPPFLKAYLKALSELYFSIDFNWLDYIEDRLEYIQDGLVVYGHEIERYYGF